MPSRMFLLLAQKVRVRLPGREKVFASKYLQAGFGGLVLCAQIEEANLWRERLKQAGRVGDGRFFSLGETFRFNFPRLRV
jgi:hypothetical protein